MPPGPEEVRRQLERIVSSEPFARTDRLSRFLCFIVDRTLAGEADALKEYVIGVEVFDRDDRYDPRVDSIVRVEAGRLRGKLDAYYNGAGQADPLVIRMRPGSYVPSFEMREQTREPAHVIAPVTDVSVTAPSSYAAAGSTSRITRRRMVLGLSVLAALFVGAAAWRNGVWTAVDAGPRIAILPFAQYSGDRADQLLADRLTDEVTSQLARIRTLAVVSHTSSLQFAGARKPIHEVARSLNADIVMEGTVEITGDRLRVGARLVDAARDRKFWVEDFAGSRSDVGELARRIAAAAADAAKQR